MSFNKASSWYVDEVSWQFVFQAELSWVVCVCVCVARSRETEREAEREAIWQPIKGEGNRGARARDT